MTNPPTTSGIVFDPFLLKPDISASSKKLYTHNLTKLNNGKPIANLNFLSKKDIPDRLNALTPNTRRTYLIAIVSCLKDRPEKKYKTLYAKFYEPLMALNKELKDNTQKTDKVKENWVEQSAVQDKRADLASVIDEVKGLKKVTEDQYNRLLNAVILSLYTLQPPRRNKDYTDMMISRGIPESTEKNYLEIDGKSWRWIFNNYKTQKKYKQQIVEVPDDLKSILEVYLKFHPESKLLKKKTFDPVPFLVHYDGKAINSSTEMTRILNKIFGKKVSVDMCRHIYLTNLYKDVPALSQMEKTASEMSHSLATALTYIKKD
jgi:integrase